VPGEAVQAFVSSMSLNWSNNGVQLAEDSKQLCGRFMRAYKDVYKFKDSPDGSNPEDLQSDNLLLQQKKFHCHRAVVSNESVVDVDQHPEHVGTRGIRVRVISIEERL